MEIKFRIDPERLTLDDLIALEDFRSTSWTERKNMLANAMVDGNDQFIDLPEAKKIIGKVTLARLNEISSEFSAAIQELMNNQLPPENGSGSI